MAVRMTRSIRPLVAVAGAFLVAGALGPLPLGAQEAPSLDAQLLEQFGADPIDEFDRELFDRDKSQDQATDRSASNGDSLRRLQRELGAAAVAEEDNPLLEIAREMREVEARIGRQDAGPVTQSLQAQIVVDLETLIEQAGKRCRQSQMGGKPSPQQGSRQKVSQPNLKSPGGTKPSDRPVATSTQRRGGSAPARRPDMQQMQALMKRLWGQLPRRDRERAVQSPPEEFLPKYELLIEAYFRRLAENELEKAPP